MTKYRYGLLTAALAVSLVSAWGGASRAQDAAVEGDAEAGAAIYSAQCKGCHTVSIAPTLRGVADRSIASVAEFGGYSPGLKAKSDDTWTAQNLDAFLTAPTRFAPGARMVTSLADPQMRADVIAYIRSLPPPRAAP